MPNPTNQSVTPADYEGLIETTLATFKDLDDVLDEEEKKKTQETAAKLQQLKADLKKFDADLKKTEDIARKFQSERDRLLAERQQQQQQDTPKELTKEEKIASVLKAQGVKEEVIPGQAKLLAVLLEQQEKEMETKFANMVRPLATTAHVGVIGEAVRTAASPANDPLGMFQIPAVRDAVNATLQQNIGQIDITPEYVSSLGKMYYADYLIETKQNGQQQPNEQQPPQMPLPNFFSSVPVYAPPPASPASTPKTTNAETLAAVQATISHWSPNRKK